MARQVAAPPHVLLAAIGDEQPVFDRLVTDLAQRLEPLRLASLVTGSASGQVGRKLASSADVYTAIRSLRPDAREGCLVYLTGHGTRAGMSLPLASERSPTRPYADLAVADMAAALQEGCGDAPTVVVFSACYSGVYLTRALLTANRIVMTAAAADRTSFGCGDDETHSYFDGCFLRAFDVVSTWRQLAARTADCVAKLERELLPGERPSRPQAWFGHRVRDMALPARR